MIIIIINDHYSYYYYEHYVSYSSQSPWLFNATLKRNVCLNSVMDMKKFNQVVEICALSRDLELLPEAEESIVGDKGSALSGGQKVRNLFSISVTICIWGAEYSLIKTSPFYLFNLDIFLVTV